MWLTFVPCNNVVLLKLNYNVAITMSGAAAGQKLSREDWRKKKELEEARKAGTAPAEVDEEGR